MKSLSVVVPAHNEAAVIGRLLGRLAGHPRFEELELVVVPNGCTDDTAARAAAVHPSILVSPIDKGSKIAALQEADRVATVFPRVYVDADVEVDADTLFALGAALDQPEGPLVASPRLVVDTAGASWPVRQHYRVWELTDYRRRGHIGSGIYALSEAGRARFGAWPDVIADDRFVQQLFPPGQRLTLTDHEFVVRSPRTLRAQIRRATRIVRGNRELPDTLQHAAPEGAGRHLNLLRRVARRPSLWPAFPIYLVSSLVASLRARREVRLKAAPDWHRDDTTRTLDE